MLSEIDDKYAYIHWSYANKEFREILRVSLDKKGFREQALGKWSAYSGGCYYAFADDNLLTETYKIDSTLPILFGFDFNVDWYSIVVAQYKDGVFYVFDEVRLSNANTRAALDVLVAKFGGLARQYIAYGDAAGRHRQTSADISDYLLIEAEKRIPMTVVFPRSNPSVVYRIERVNSFLKTADQHIRLLIAPKCRCLVKDLFSVTWAAGERTQDKKNPELTHMCFAGETLVNGQRISEMPERGHVNTMFGTAEYTNPGVRGYKPLVEVTLENGETFRCTPDHLLLTNKGWVQALDSIGTWGYCKPEISWHADYGTANRHLAEKVAWTMWSEFANDAEGHVFVKIVNVKPLEGLHPVFCPTVDNGHFVLDNGLVVSNSDALGYLLISHEENYGQHRVILMKEHDLRVAAEKRTKDGYDVSSKPKEKFVGQMLLAPAPKNSTIFTHGGK
jgi:hypothetical protein